MNTKLLTLSPSPHIRHPDTTSGIMYNVVIALVPAFIVSVLFFGLGAITVTLTAVCACVVFEYLIQRYMLKVPPTTNDGSAIVTGVLLAFNLPSNIPIWMVVVGSAVAIGVAKMTFGGLGKNPFNPALVGRVFLLISFPVEMTLWPKPAFLSFSALDGTTGATVLGIMKGGLAQGQSVAAIMDKLPGYQELFMGQMGGSLGEISALALVLGGGYLLYKRIITWHIPITFIATVAVFAGICNFVNPASYADPMFHILSGGLMLGAIYMATDMVTSPMAPRGMVVFGIGCGLLTIIIRIFGAYPEGVSFAILIMNAFTPIINRVFKPQRFGAK